ncbi:MAG: GNAT family N-acetyltransferase [Chitinophagaceae bacterium]|nr:GNAT family N-acetyltransferase [Chitinophagaceae bacterium]
MNGKDGKFIVNFKPTEAQVGEIKKWLMEEDRKTGDGFYCNWKTIKSSFDNEQLVTISHLNKAIGFVTYDDSITHTVKIVIAEIQPFYRGKGVGRFFISELSRYWAEKGCVVLFLECSPETSAPIWMKLGFKEYTDSPEKYRFSLSSGKQLFQILMDHLEPNHATLSNEKIELWNDELYRVRNTEPKYIWYLDFIPNTRKLKKPIVHPAHYDWRIRWSSNSKTIKDDKIKYFGNEIIYGTFIVIKDLPDIGND